ncbi:alpha-1,2-fucosyltransferase [Mucilaginibacter phyllosphaerae]|uniref:Alpha-1,2-fucosyltransferase n=1 Tax=Mucilaginibacter phyllosphaerae TaxID=1812349 RepID=A0A4Y8AGF5_9SPHI|nr:alpha-1,2-fucosyltransferase [Mucilaginibacter phyllosphaerae]MBB3968546.1 hypothetical protein [Mucilaginibacter phyllosphaerae]TEW67813.1 alpha-1,2-fucosyltransferase [Mucilaginibacter phyllosphaerae]GGH15342.1 alpha-1,2-fucosyltransferase [Mucilaginibacter phyllosphaerae]
MIAVRLEGRLGNQLFQYAFIYSAAKRLNTSYYIDQYTTSSSVDKYFDTNMQLPGPLVAKVFSIKSFKNIFNFHLRRLYYKRLAQFHRLTINQFTISDSFNDVALIDNCIYSGYFQSEIFFKNFEPQIHQWFTLKPEHKNAFHLKYNHLYQNNRIVTIHVRRTDYQNLQHLNLGNADLTLPLGYYQNAISNLNDENTHFVFITDDVPFVTHNFRFLTNKTISADTEILDFQHMMNADVCIISNSTFSWWGAWLNSNKNKTVYCPQYYLGYHLKKDFPPNIYPDDWKQIAY